MSAFSEMYIQELKTVLDSFPHAQFDQFIRAMLDAYENQKHIFVMGNGGSGATASHFACDINKGCCGDLDKKFKVICLNDNIPTILALANDDSYESVFVEQLKNFFEPGDVVIGISGSGNSENVIRAVEYAKNNDGKTIGLSGFSGGELAQLVDIPFVFRINDMQKVEDGHLIVVHMLMQTLHNVLHSVVAITTEVSGLT